MVTIRGSRKVKTKDGRMFYVFFVGQQMTIKENQIGEEVFAVWLYPDMCDFKGCNWEDCVGQRIEITYNRFGKAEYGYIG